MSIVIPSIPSIIIPTKDNIIQKEFLSINGGITPVEKDSSTWATVIYERWGIKQIDDDLSNRIGNLDSIELEEVENAVLKIKEGIRIFSERIQTSPDFPGYIKKIYVKNFQWLLDFKQQIIDKKRQDITVDADKLINRMEKFRQDLEKGQVKVEEIDKEKKEINKETLKIKQMGANRECLRHIGRVMKTVYSEISIFLNRYKRY